MIPERVQQSGCRKARVPAQRGSSPQPALQLVCGEIGKAGFEEPPGPVCVAQLGFGAAMGAIGGFMLSGFIGLFVGAVVLALGYKLFMAWLGEAEAVEADSA